MKSNKEQLQSRGYAGEEDCINYKNFSGKELIELLYDEEPYKRTIAVTLLSEYKNEKYIPLFCECLKTEKKLYTKIALCNSLIDYNEKAIPYLIPLLGTIGNNRHKKIEPVDIHKKSYPLPRDIVGRILIRLGPTVFPELKKIILHNTTTHQVTEAIEVIGHITRNYKDYSLENSLIDYYTKNKGNEFIEWKLIRAFQAFNSEKVKALLQETIKLHTNKIIIEEAKRSMKRISEHTENGPAPRAGG
jgi:hypothetical protein